MTYNEQLANVIKNHKNDTGNDWQAKAFRLLHEKYSLISLKDGFGDNNLKASIEKGWSKWCKEKNPNLPTSKDRCGICTGPASGILVLDVDNLEKFRECPACFLIFLSVVSSSHETDRLSRCA